MNIETIVVETICFLNFFFQKMQKNCFDPKKNEYDILQNLNDMYATILMTRKV